MHLYEYIEVIQPTTLFGRFKPQKSNVVYLGEAAQELEAPQATSSSGVSASCNLTITVSCLQQIYNTVGYKPTAKNNSIGITGYLAQFANFKDLESFYAEQVPAAKGSSFKVVSVNGVSALFLGYTCILSPLQVAKTIKPQGWPALRPILTLNSRSALLTPYLSVSAPLVIRIGL